MTGAPPMSEYKAGPELDAEVAEKVMGWPVIESAKAGYWSKRPHVVVYQDGSRSMYSVGINHWSPSTDPAAAWEVVEKMRSDGWGYELGSPCYNSPECNHRCNFHRWARDEWIDNEATAPTMMEAVCLAALAAVEKGEEP